MQPLHATPRQKSIEEVEPRMTFLRPIVTDGHAPYKVVHVETIIYLLHGCRDMDRRPLFDTAINFFFIELIVLIMIAFTVVVRGGDRA